MRIGLVLEGGAMRGLFTAGALDVFMENEVSFDGVVGVSAGAVFGCNLKSGQIGRVLRYNKKYCRNWRYCSWRSLLLTGDMFGTDFCYRKLPEELDVFDKAAYDGNPMEFHLVCTDVTSGEAIYHQCDKADRECMEWMRASASMPLVSSIVHISGRQCLDGAISDSIPLKFMEELGYRRNIVILTQPQGYLKQPSSLQWLVNIVYRKYPALLKATAHRHRLYNSQVEYAEKRQSDGAVLIIRPEDSLPIQRITNNPDLLQETYDIGRRTTEKQLDWIKEFIAHAQSS